MISLQKPWFPGFGRSEVVMKFTQIFASWGNPKKHMPLEILLDGWETPSSSEQLPID